MAGAKDRDDGTTRAMIYDGCSISQLVQAFDMDARDVSKKLRNVAPCGERRGFPIYKLKDAAKALVPPEVSEEDILAYIGSMNFKNLPPALNKEVWNGLRARLRFEQEQGNHWLTPRIQEVVSRFMQTTRMALLLLPDELERAGELSQRQRTLCERYVDSKLAELQQLITEAMRDMPEMTPGIMDFTDGDDDGIAIDRAEDEVSETVEEDFDL